VSAGLRVLVADDHPVNRLVMGELLSHLGCVVSLAEDGVQALSRSLVDRFDLICLDRHMPGLSGDEVAERLPAEQFVLAWSTDVSDLPKRYNGALSKPVSLPALQAALQRAGAWREASTRGARFPALKRA
jgi:two-component system, sensor histidine kinase